MDDWQIGDLALCVDTGISPEGFDCRTLSLGKIYTVYGIGIDPLGQLGLFLDEQDSTGHAGGYLAWRFRKIRPHTPDAEDTETIRLLSGEREPVPAHLDPWLRKGFEGVNERIHDGEIQDG